MKLKRLKTFGFKTFAEPTTIEFGGGITAVVGPNGSGKSNIVDAIRWVLGETSTRSLRSNKLEDVIFAGNDQRKPLGLAEVSVTFDNTDRALPIEYAEVEITRRAYRAGQSEFFINRSEVRLRDVHDLLMGTGLGPGSYAIVSQGEIDAVLKSRPTERRELFEEAAGISKFLVRKHESLRRLEQTEANAIRINDLIAEAERRIPELEGQVRRARRYRKLNARVRDLEILGYLRASASRRRERDTLRESLQADDERRSRATARVAEAANRLGETRTMLYQKELELEELRAHAQSRRDELKKLEIEYAGALARREALESLSTQTSEDAQRVAQERVSLEAAIATFDAEQAPLERQTAQAREREVAAQSAVIAARGRLDAVFSQLRAIETQAAEVAARRAERRVHGENVRQEVQRSESELERARERTLELELAAGAAKQQHDRAKRSVEEAEDGVAELREALRQAEHDAREVHGDVLRAQSLQRDQLAKVTAAESRLHTIEELENALEGHVPGTRAVVEAGARGELGGIEGVVSNLITIDERFARAMDVAFGARLSNVVTRSAADAERAIEFLNRTELGRATFMPLERLSERTAPQPGRSRLSREPGIIGYGSELLHTDKRYEPVVEFLVGSVLVVDTLRTGLRIVRERGFTGVVVTLPGEMIVGGRTISGGRFQRERSILSRRAQATHLREQLPEMRAQLAQYEAQMRNESSRSDIAVAKRDAARDRVTAGDLQLAELRAEAASRATEHERLRAEFEQARGEIETITERLRDARERERGYEAGDTAADRSDAERRRLEAELERVRSDIRRAEEALGAERAASGNVLERGSSVAAQRNAAASRLAMLDEDEERSRDARERTLAEIGTLLGQTRNLHERIEGLRRGVADVDARLERARAERESLVERQSLREAEQREAESEERRIAREGEEAHTRLTQVEAELGMIVAQFAQNPATDEECRDVETRYSDEPDAVIDDVPRLRDELSRLSANVNLNAEADREAVAERDRFLRAQFADLSAARETLLRSIKEIEQQTQAQFNETFDRVSTEFSKSFARLFEGGIARMWQTNPENLSETGIEITAQPPGKKQMPLQALSGGERAMTAAALVFALISVRPSPFYLLDEVDAAMDDANVERFCAMVRDELTDSDTVIVTHNKKTMEIASRMYGVTMRESGVSSIVSVELVTREPLPAIA